MAYFDSVRVRNTSIPVYLDPDGSDIKELTRNKFGKPTDDIRLLVDFEHGQVYAWDAYETTHYSMMEAMRLWPTSYALAQVKFTSRGRVWHTFLLAGKKKFKHYTKDDFAWLRQYASLVEKDSLNWLRKMLH